MKITKWIAQRRMRSTTYLDQAVQVEIKRAEEEKAEEEV
jgi:hypothetical protein